jgi:tRNA(Arg) A34 adenosine deaminase TadA
VTPLRIEIALPAWLAQFSFAPPYPTDEDKVGLALELARRNIAEASGGPFGAAVFERTGGKLIAAGVNLVVPARASIAHAEMVALTLAEQVLGSHDLSRHNCELATSVEPCAMCLGAIPWSGLSRVLCGARDEDARAIGFNEGAKPADWRDVLANHEIESRADVLRDQARQVLEEYRAGGGPIYNPSR